MSNTKIITAACGVVAAAGLIATGATLSNAATPAAQTGTGTYSNAFGSGGPSGDRGHGSNDTPVTGTELSKVKAAVKAKDSAVTVTEVRKDPDGSYDVFGTKSGSPVMLEVSKDLKTITTGPGRGGHSGGSQPAPSASSSSTSTT